MRAESPLNILVLSRMFPHEGDPSSGVFVYEQLRALRALGVNAEVIAPKPWVPRVLSRTERFGKFLRTPSRDVLDGFAVEYPRVPLLPNGRMFFLSGLAYYLRCRTLLRRRMQEQKIDLIHAHSLVPEGFAAVLLGSEFNLPVVCTAHGSDVKVYPQRSRGMMMATRWALRRLQNLIAVSADLAQNINKLVGERPCTVIPNGVDPERFRRYGKSDARRQLGLAEDKKIVLFVGRMVPVKGLEHLLQAVVLLARQDLHLYLIGEGELKPMLMTRASELGVDKQCHFLGYRTHDEVPLWLSASDCTVLPSLTEGFPTILPEAMICGSPMIATMVGGIPEVIVHGRNGMLVPPRDAAALALAISQVLDDESLAGRLRTQAQTDVARNLTWASNARSTLAAYWSALGHSGQTEPVAQTAQLRRVS